MHIKFMQFSVLWKFVKAKAVIYEFKALKKFTLIFGKITKK